MEPKYTTAFIGITLSGELYIARQYKGKSLIDCAKWRRENKDEVEQLYGEVRAVTLPASRKLYIPYKPWTE